MKTYATCWQRWSKWSKQKLGFSEISTNPLHIALYLQDLLNDAKENCKSPSVIVSAVDSIRWGHKMALVENPTEHLMVQYIVNASKRILGRPVKPKEPVSIDTVQSIASFYFTSVPSLAILRFLFVLLVCHAGLLRADEL